MICGKFRGLDNTGISYPEYRRVSYASSDPQPAVDAVFAVTIALEAIVGWRPVVRGDG
jgi:hypothetical protein